MKGKKAGALVLGRGREAGVVERQIDLPEEAVGLVDLVYAGEPEFLGQALVQGSEHALKADEVQHFTDTARRIAEILSLADSYDRSFFL